jgi:hypothetical protein
VNLSSRGELPIQYSASTIEHWYYAARGAKQDPVRVLRRIIRKDCGKISLPAVQVEQLLAQYRAHEHWSYQLHYDNLAAWVQAHPTHGPLRSYSTVRRYMQAHGWLRKRRPSAKGRPGMERAAQRRERRENNRVSVRDELIASGVLLVPVLAVCWTQSVVMRIMKPRWKREAPPLTVDTPRSGRRETLPNW